MEFSTFSMGKHFVGRARALFSPGRIYGPWGDCFPPEYEVSVEEIYMKLGTRQRELRFDAINAEAKDRILRDIEDDILDQIKNERGYEIYDKHVSSSGNF